MWSESYKYKIYTTSAMQKHHKDLHEVFEYFTEPIICMAEDKTMSHF
jgi:hypothetical protein